MVKHFGEPLVLTTDKAPALLCVFKKLKKHVFYKQTIHCTIKHFNNFIEPDHEHIKRRFVQSYLGFKLFVMFLALKRNRNDLRLI